MNFICGFLLVLASSFSELQVTSAVDDAHFVNEWAVEIPGGERVARDVAAQHGYRFVRSFDVLEDHYILERSDTPHRSRRGADHHTRKLSEDDRVVFAEQQQHKVRVKRSVMTNGKVDDPEFENQWYLNQGDSDTNRRDGVLADLRVKAVWEMGYTGEGSVVCVIDDGIECTHDDLKQNCDRNASWDYNDNDPDPSPRYDPTNENKHGTRCAGEIAMTANNKICGVGIAPDAKIGGIRMLDGKVTDSLEARSLGFNPDHIDIYTSSWGPNDDGRTVEAPGQLTKRVLERGVKTGRKGLGNVYVVAAGNGGPNNDNCNADGYTSSIYTISVSSVSQRGTCPYYSEKCASTLTSAPSSGSSTEGKVISADLHNQCTNSHSGTSAAAPMAAGIYALLLQRNRGLTWRDFQHCTVHTSRAEPTWQDKGWYRNGAGYCVNLAFGFGFIDAEGIVKMADPKTYRNVGEQRICRVEPVKSSGFPRDFRSGESVEVEMGTDACKGQENEINYVEHIQVLATVSHERRGNIYMEVQSATNTITPVMMERNKDDSPAGFNNWYFTSVHFWGENPRGTWFLRVADRSSDGLRGSLKNATLIIYGTKEQPEHQKNISNKCAHLPQYANTLHNMVDGDRSAERYQSLKGSMKLPFSSVGGQKLPSQHGQTLTQEKSSLQSVEALKTILETLSHG